MFLSSGDGYVGELLELPQGCQGPFRGSRGKIGFLSRCLSPKGPHLALRRESPGFSRVAAGDLGFLLSYDRNLTDCSCGLRKVQSLCELREAARDYSPVASRAVVLIWS